MLHIAGGPCIQIEHKSRYISTAVGEEDIDLAATQQALRDIEQEVQAALHTHNAFLKELGLAELP
jgi:type I restriction enzyme M protein